MTGHVLTQVSAVVTPGQEDLLVSAYREGVGRPKPDGLLRTELMRADGDRWCIQTLWRDRAALDAMRAAPEPPVALRLFRAVGAEPTLTVFSVVEDWTA